MATQKQIEANRRNAQKSTGPRTQEGKAAARFNAVRHGLRTLAVEVLPNEDADAFERVVVGWVRSLDSRTEAEVALARQAATISWKLDRANRCETAVLSRRVIDAVNACDCEDDDVQTLHEAAAIASFDPSSGGERLRRYQFALMRELRQTIDAFAKLRKQAIAPNEANLAGADVKVGDFRSLVSAGSRDPRRAVDEAGGRDARTTTDVPAPNEAISDEPVILPNEAISQADSVPPRRNRDRWPLETLKRKRRQAKQRQRQASAFAK